ncbi:MAG: hypothetical protein GXP34_14530, partial [Actinobacteria bacterium]|nr:hypothetical protein [Actinomycetota bacterium]
CVDHDNEYPEPTTATDVDVTDTPSVVDVVDDDPPALVELVVEPGGRVVPEAAIVVVASVDVEVSEIAIADVEVSEIAIADVGVLEIDIVEPEAPAAHASSPASRPSPQSSPPSVVPSVVRTLCDPDVRTMSSICSDAAIARSWVRSPPTITTGSVSAIVTTTTSAMLNL